MLFKCATAMTPIPGTIQPYSLTYKRGCFGVQVQCSALEILPLIPAHKLRSLLAPDGRLVGTLTRQMGAALKEVRAAALSAAGRWLADTGRSAVLAANSGILVHAQKWAELIVDALTDPAPAVSAAAFDAARYIDIS